MPFRARQIDPSGSAQARLGAELRNLREERRLSQARLAELIRYSPDLIRRIEAAERHATREFAAACDEALGAQGALVRLWTAAAEERASLAPPRPRRAPGVTARFDAPISQRVIEDWLHSDASVSSPRRGHPWVTEEDVLVADDMLRMFRTFDHAHGAGQFAAHLRLYLDTELGALLARPAATPAVAAQRARVATGFYELAGYQAVDSGRPGWAQMYYGHALRLAGEAGDRPYGAYLVAANLAHLALHCDKPLVALRWAEAASSVAQSAASPATRAAVTAVAARAQARLDNERETTRLLTQAEALLDASRPADEPQWIAYFTHGYLADEMAHCHYDLGRPPTARAQVTEAIDSISRNHVRRRAIDATLLAATWLRSGEAEQACIVGREAVDLTVRTSSGRCVERVAHLSSELAAYDRSPVVAEFQDYLRTVLPTAASGTGARSPS